MSTGYYNMAPLTEKATNVWMMDHEGTSYVAGSSGVTGVFDKKLYTSSKKTVTIPHYYLKDKKITEMKNGKIARQYIYMFPLKDYIPKNNSTELLYNSYDKRNKPQIFEGDDEKTIVTRSITWSQGKEEILFLP